LSTRKHIIQLGVMMKQSIQMAHDFANLSSNVAQQPR
jgi:hypothetical protein